METKDKIKAYIEETFLFGQGDLEEDTPLIEYHVIDSTGILEVIAFVERTFHLQVGDDEVIPENFNSVKSIASYIERKKGS
jgi:acyl carrier protein